MQVLVTGGSGFIGSELICQLAQQNVTNYNVRALLRQTSSMKNLQNLNFQPVQGSLQDLKSLKKAVQGVDVVFHLAGVIAARSKKEYFDHNAEGTKNLLQACMESAPQLKRFVYVSSLAASGPANTLTPRIEDALETPVSSYGESKLEGERILKRQANFPVTIVRPPIVYGPKDKGVFEFVKIINNHIFPILKGKNETKEKYYSVVYVDDLVQGILHAGFSEKQGKLETFFLADDSIYSWSQIMSNIETILRKKTIKVPLPFFVAQSIAAIGSLVTKFSRKLVPLNLDKIKELKPDFWICSNLKAKKVLGFDPQFNLSQGMEKTIAWYKENQWIV